MEKTKKSEQSVTAVTKNTPVKKFRAGAVTATVWDNAVKDSDPSNPTTYSTISLERIYKDKEDQWQSTNSMRVNDLPKAMLVLNKAYEFVLMERQKEEVA